jgi:hypothetical protein
MKSRLIVACLIGLGMIGCDLPQDPEGTLDSIRGQELRVGVLNYGENGRADRLVVERFAADLRSRIAYRDGDAHALFEDLKRGEIHLVIGGVPETTPFASELGLSKAVGPLVGADNDENRVMAVRPGENAFLLKVNEAIEKAKAEGALP